MATLINIVCGSPCSGKTTYTNSFADIYHLSPIILSADELFAKIADEINDVVTGFEDIWLDYCYRSFLSAKNSYIVLDGLSNQDITEGEASIFTNTESIKHFINYIKERYAAEQKAECPYRFIIHYLTMPLSSCEKIYKGKKKRRSLEYVQRYNSQRQPYPHETGANYILKIKTAIKDNNSIIFDVPKETSELIQAERYFNPFAKKLNNYAETLLPEEFPQEKTILFCVSPSYYLEKSIIVAAHNAPIFKHISEIEFGESGTLVSAARGSKDCIRILQDIHHFFEDNGHHISDYSFVIYNLIPDAGVCRELGIVGYHQPTITREELGFNGLNIKIENKNFIFDAINSFIKNENKGGELSAQTL